MDLTTPRGVTTYVTISFVDTVQTAIVKLQKDPPDVPSWLYVVHEAIPSIVDALRHWLTIASKKTARQILTRYNRDYDKDLSSGKTPHSAAEAFALESAMDAEHRRVQTFVDGMSDNKLIDLMKDIGLDNCPGHDDLAKREKWLLQKRDLLVVTIMKQKKADNQDSVKTRGGGIFIPEMRWFTKFRVFALPPVLRKRHDHFSELWQAAKDSKDLSVESHFKEVRLHAINLEAFRG